MRQRGGDDDVAGDGEAVGDQPEHVQRQHEHEQREHEGEEAHAFLPGGRAHHAGDEFVGQFRGRLQARGHRLAAGGADHQEQREPDHGDQHEQRGIGEGDLGVAELAERKQVDDLELVDGIHDVAS